MCILRSIGQWVYMKHVHSSFSCIHISKIRVIFALRIQFPNSFFVSHTRGKNYRSRFMFTAFMELQFQIYICIYTKIRTVFGRTVDERDGITVREAYTSSNSENDLVLYAKTKRETSPFPFKIKINKMANYFLFFAINIICLLKFNQKYSKPMQCYAEAFATRQNVHTQNNRMSSKSINTMLYSIKFILNARCPSIDKFNQFME